MRAMDAKLFLMLNFTDLEEGGLPRRRLALGKNGAYLRRARNFTTFYWADDVHLPSPSDGLTGKRWTSAYIETCRSPSRVVRAG